MIPMNKNMTRFLIILAAVLVVFLVVAFVPPFVKTATFWLALVFGLIAIAGQLYVQPRAFGSEKARSKFYGFPIGQLGVVWLAAQLVLSVVFMALAALIPAWVAAVVFVLLTAAAVAGFVGVDATRDEIERQDEALKANVASMRALQSKAATLAARAAGSGAEKPLQELAEAFRFSDPVSSPATAELEGELSADLDLLTQALLDEDEPAAADLAAKLTVTLTERNRLCRLNK